MTAEYTGFGSPKFTPADFARYRIWDCYGLLAWSTGASARSMEEAYVALEPQLRRFGIERFCPLLRLEVPALLQVNLAGEASKGGVAPEAITEYLRYGIRGLATMPPPAADPEESRPVFRHLRELAAEQGLAELSMGTTQDYRVAVEEGATYVRVGSVLFI